MLLEINCYSSNNEIFMAHLIHEDKENINFNCGICMYGKIKINKKYKIIENSQCDNCNSRIQIVKNSKCDITS
jgi:hypothetical protein